MHRLHHFILTITFASLAASLAEPAFAADPAALAAAQALVDEGSRAAAAGDFNAALDRFRAAYARVPSANILLNIGTALRRLGRNPEAAVAYEKYLRDPQASPERVAEIQRALAELDATVARVTIGAGDPGARIWVDGSELVGFGMGGTVRLSPGDHVIAGGRAGPLASENVRVAAGEVRSVYLKLTPPPAAAPAVPFAPGAAPGVAAPPGGAPMVVMVQDDDRRERRARRPMSPQKIAAATLDIVGGLSLATGMGLGIAALVMSRDASDHCLDGGAACEPRALELERDAGRFGKASSILLGTGAGLLLTGIILQAADRSARYDDARAARIPRVGLAAGKGSGFVTVEASW